MEIDFAPSHNPTLFGSLSVSPPTSMLDSFSPLLHFNEDFLDVLNPPTPTMDDDVEDWLKPLLFDQIFEHDLSSNLLNFNDFDVKQERSEDEKPQKMNSNYPLLIEDKFLLNNSTNNYSQSQRETELISFLHQQTSEQQLPATTTTTTTVRLIHQPKLEPADLPTTLFVSGNELQFHSIVNNTNSKTIGHTYTSQNLTSSPIPSTVPIVPARVLKGKKFKRGGRVTSRATSRSNAAAKRRLNSTAAEPKASVVIIAEDATKQQL